MIVVGRMRRNRTHPVAALLVEKCHADVDIALKLIAPTLFVRVAAAECCNTSNVTMGAASIRASVERAAT